MVVTLFGAAGHMGFPTLQEFLKIKEIDRVNVLLEKKYKRNKLVEKLSKENPGRIEIFYGSVANVEDVTKTVEGSSYLFNLAAAIPPRSDKFPEDSRLANEVGVKNIVEVIEKHKEVKLIDITTVALYGHRNKKNPWVRVGDPLFPGVFDFYTVHKLRGEFAILESDIPNWTIIRQSAMIYLDMLTANMGDGLMFHTPFNNPIEWSTAEDSARLLANTIRADIKGELNHDNFWGKIFNLGSGEENRITGYETVQGGFSLFGGDVKDFYNPNDCCVRNFHCGYFADGERLNNMFHYREDKIDEYWAKILKAHPILKASRIAPKSLIKKFTLEKTMKDSNAPQYWYAHNDEARITAYFGSMKEYEDQPREWKDFDLWDYKNERSIVHYKPIDYGFNIEKSDKDITYEDLLSVAKKHGGKLLSKKFKTGDVYAKLEWENQDGEKFIARPFTVLRGGHWWNALYTKYEWDFDRLAKKDEIYAQLWYDSHEKDENHLYYFDESLEAKMK